MPHDRQHLATWLGGEIPLYAYCFTRQRYAVVLMPRKRQLKNGERPVYPFAVCINCEKKYEQIFNRQKFCSNSCRVTYFNKKKYGQLFNEILV